MDGQPWVVYGLLRTEDAVTPSLTTGDVLVSLTGYVIVYAVLISFDLYYIDKLLRDGNQTWLVVIGVLSLIGIVVGTRIRCDRLQFANTAVFFHAAFLSLGVMFRPCMILYSITVADAAAPNASFEFLIYGGIVVLPVIAVYTIGVYRVFRGKVQKG